MYSMFVIYNSFSDLEKTELFMELYGNVLMNSHALEYLKNKSNDLIRYKLYPLNTVICWLIATATVFK